MEDEGDNNSFLDGLIPPDVRRRTREQTQPFMDVLCSPRCIRSSILTVGSAIFVLTTLLIAISLTQQPIDAPSIKPEMELYSVPTYMLNQVTDPTLRTHLQFLSSDLMEGRGTGTRGELLATGYIATHFTMAGLQPAANNGSYFQHVPLVSVTPSTLPELYIGDTQLAYLEDFTATTDYFDFTQTDSVNISGAEMVFVGYGIVAPSYGWDDYKGVDVAGKIVVVFVNEPNDTTNMALFAGDTLTYYGRWTYKYEQARAKGALGVVLIHTPAMAGYGWTVVVNSFSGEQVMLAEPPLKNPLAYKGWISEDAARDLAGIHGYTLEQWMNAASRSSFTPIPLDKTKFSVNVEYSVDRFSGTNVVARLGPEPVDGTETVVFMAHHDHLGIRPDGSNGDKIYNGAVDNASGLASLIMSAYALGALYAESLVTAVGLEPLTPKRTFLFVSFTGEESNLLGSQYFTAYSPCKVPLCGATSALNYDIMNVWGKTTDMVAIGTGMSQYMDKLVLQAAKEESVTIVDDPTPHLGHLFRSDQLPFALHHVPSVTLSAGTDFEGKPADYYNKVTEEYVDDHYHQPTDEYDPSWSMEGVIQQTRLLLRVAYRLAVDTPLPEMDNSELLPPKMRRSA